MIKSLIKLALFLAVGILVYNYFFGDTQEKESSRAVFQQTKDLVGSVVGLLASEKEKFNEGKYDKALDNIGDALGKLGNAVEGSADLFNKVKGLEQRKQELQQKIDAEASKSDHDEQDVSQMSKEMDALLDDTKKLIEEAERQR